MKKIVPFLLLILTVSIASAQIPNWTWGKNSNLYSNSKQDMTAVDNDGNVYLVGDFNTATATIAGTTLINTSDSGYSDAYILKFNSTGTLLWSKQITGTKHESIQSLDTDNSNNLYIDGTFGSLITIGNTVLTGNPGGNFIAKLNSNGDYVWVKQNSGANESHTIQDIKVDNNGNVFTTGYLYSTATVTYGNVVMSLDPTSTTFNDFHAYIAKFDPNGNCLWGKVGSISQTNPMGDIPMSVAPDNNGGAAICGRFSHNIMTFDTVSLTKTTQNNNAANMFVIKFDSNGTALWGYNAGSIYNNNTMGSAVSIDLNGNVYVGGSYPNSVHFGSTTLSAFNGSQLYLVKYSPTGTFLWAKSTGATTSGYTTVRSIDTDPNGNVYTAGLAYSTAIDFTNNVTLSNLGTVGAFFVTKYNSSGTTIWAKGVTNIDANNDLSIDCKAENDLFIGGTFDKSTLQLGPIQLTKSASGYDLFIGRLYAAPLGTTEFDSNTVSIFPNPARDEVHITNLKTIYSYNLYNILGEIVMQGIILNEQETLNVNTLQSGLYILKLIDQSGKAFQKKIMVE